MHNKQYNEHYMSATRSDNTDGLQSSFRGIRFEAIAWIAVVADSVNQLFGMSNVKAGANDPTAQDKEQSVKDVRLLLH